MIFGGSFNGFRMIGLLHTITFDNKICLDIINSFILVLWQVNSSTVMNLFLYTLMSRLVRAQVPRCVSVWTYSKAIC